MSHMTTVATNPSARISLLTKNLWLDTVWPCELADKLTRSKRRKTPSWTMFDTMGKLPENLMSILKDAFCNFMMMPRADKKCKVSNFYWQTESNSRPWGNPEIGWWPCEPGRFLDLFWPCSTLLGPKQAHKFFVKSLMHGLRDSFKASSVDFDTVSGRILDLDYLFLSTSSIWEIGG